MPLCSMRSFPLLVEQVAGAGAQRVVALARRQVGDVGVLEQGGELAADDSALWLLGGVGLLLDFASWWLTRLNASFVFLLIGAGGTWAAVIGLAGALVVCDLWLPRGNGASASP